MSRDPFDEFKKFEKMFREMLENDGLLLGGSGYSVSVQKIGDETKVKVNGDVSERDIEQLKRKYPDSEIVVNDEEVGDGSPVEVLDDSEYVSSEKESNSREKGPEIEEVDEDEIEPEELALKRFEERKKEE